MRFLTKFLLIVLLLVLLGASLWFFCFRVLLADAYFLQTIQLESDENWPEILTIYQRIFDLQAQEPFYQTNFALLLSSNLGVYRSSENKLQIVDVAIERMKEVISEYPHFNTIWNLAHIYEARGKISQSQNDFLRAEEYFEKATKISPQMAKIYSDWAGVRIEQKNWEGALEKCRQAIDLYPQLSLNTPLTRKLELKKEMAQVYEQAGKAYFNLQNYPKSEEMYIQSLKLDPFGRPNLWKKIADIHYQQGDFITAIDRNLHGMVLSPEDEAWPLAIALLYYEKEKIEIGLDNIDFNNLDDENLSDSLIKAKEYFQKTLELDPDNQTALQFLGPDPKK
ncbi:tetratricopeptide repeat protein [Patescibacteria group bacterium]|nr:tetratricopeptide repeat protein [Patescibacteria group bacterium]